MKALERDAEDRFVLWIAQQGFRCWKLRIDGQNGFPDRTVTTDRGTIFFEFKRPGEHLRPEQVRVIQMLRESGAVVCVVYSLAEAKDCFKDWYRGNNDNRS